MTRSAPPDRSRADLRSPPVFPRPVGTFAGRRAELDRILAHLERDVLFFIYGVPGIGKSELAYQLIHEARAQPRWRDAIPILVEVRPDTTAPRILAQLLSAVGATPMPRRAQPEAGHLGEQLARLARQLDARRYLLLLDDVHHLPPASVAEALAYLARRVQGSRLLVASRRELALAPEAPPPVITTLGPLDPAAAGQLMAALAERRQVEPPDPARLLRVTHGSPFRIHRMLVRDAEHAGGLAASLAELSPPARRVLLTASVAQHRPSAEVLRRTWSDEVVLDDALRELGERFLLDVEHRQLVVHDLIRDELLGQVSADELATAHEDAAALCVGELHDDERPRLLLAVDAANHYLAAGRAADAWALIEAWHARLAAAGIEHLLRAPLEQLRDALPARQVAIDLLIARGLVRESRFEDAGRVLARIGADRSEAEEARHCVLAGELAQQAGERAHADELFERAVARAPDRDTRFGARLRTASAALFADDGSRARLILDAALDELPDPAPRQLARAAWARTVSWMLDERFDRAAEEAGRVRRELAGAGLDDLSNQLAMLETLCCIECEDMAAARAAAQLIDEAGLRRRVASLYRAIIAYADGEPGDASATLRALHDDLRGHGDTINAYLAGYYGSAALAESGQLDAAQALAAQTSQLAQRAGLGGPAARAQAQQALFAAEAMQLGLAHRLADQALASRHIGPRSRAKAHRAHSHAYTIEGDITRALEHVGHARAAVADLDLPAADAAIDVEHAAVDLVGGNLERAVERAERAIEHYRERSRDFEAARAGLVLAATYIARGRRTDLLYAERALAEARALADRGRLRSLQVGCAILAAALARRGAHDRSASEVLADALRQLDPERGSLHAAALMAAIDGGAIAGVVPGAVALLAHLGFSEKVDCYLIDQHGRRAATAQDVARERTLRELFVDETRAVIVARRGAFEIRGRPMLCALLSVLVQARGQPVSPDTLYTRVWDVDEYHPLQHRNALYVAINRLRACLRDAIGEREVVERVSTGWRLADRTDACVAMAVRQPSR